MRMILFQQSLQSVGVCPHSIIRISGIVRGLDLFHLTSTFVSAFPVGHGDVLLHDLVIRGIVRVLEREMPIYCLFKRTTKDNEWDCVHLR
jgi:hypothetical protein